MLERINHAACGVIVLNREGFILEVNQTLTTLLQYATSEELMGEHFEKILTPISKLVFHSYFYPNLQLEGVVKELFIKCVTASGEELSFMLSARLSGVGDDVTIDCILLEMTKRMQYEQDLKLAQRQAKDAYLGIEKIKNEIEQKQIELLKINEELINLSITDKLTGLKNRRFFQERFEQLYAQYEDVQQSFYLLVIDIDFFKKVNDTFGHLAGDEVLAQLASLIQEVTSNQLEAFRYGGEEFVMLISSEDDDYVQAMAEHLRQQVEDALFSIGHITISIGGAKVKAALTKEMLFELADRALYQSKHEGRNRVTFLV